MYTFSPLSSQVHGHGTRSVKIDKLKCDLVEITVAAKFFNVHVHAINQFHIYTKAIIIIIVDSCLIQRKKEYLYSKLITLS